MAQKAYRQTTLGFTLQESLDELLQNNQITSDLAEKIRVQFDHSITAALENRVRSRLTFTAGQLHTYRFCDNVWSFVLNDVEFRDGHEFANVDKLKVVACEGNPNASVNLKRRAIQITPPKRKK